MTFARLRALFRSRPREFQGPSLVEQYRRVWKVEHPKRDETVMRDQSTPDERRRLRQMRVTVIPGGGV